MLDYVRTHAHAYDLWLKNWVSEWKAGINSSLNDFIIQKTLIKLHKQLNSHLTLTPWKCGIYLCSAVLLSL